MNIVIRELKENEDMPNELLLSADPSSEVQKEYINDGKCYIATINNQVVGEYVLQRLTGHLAEVRNIAVLEKFQNMGIGKQLLKHSFETALNLGCKQIQIATGNSSIKQLKLYQKMGFEIDRFVKNYFIDRYPQQIFEDGIQCKDMIILKKELNNSERNLN